VDRADVSVASIDTRAHVVPVPGARLHVEVQGTGPDVLFIGGSNWDLRVNRHAFGWLPGHRIVTFDHRGLGRSRPDDTHTPFTIAEFARDAVAVLDALGIGQASVVGYSFGAMVAQHLAATAPERTVRLALIAAGPGGPLASWPIHELAELPNEQRARRLLEIQDLRVGERGAARADVAAQARRLHEAAGRSPQNGPARLLAARADHDARALLPLIDTDTTVIAGRHDGQAPLAITEALAAGISGARLLVLPGGHGFIADPDGPLSHLARLWHGDPVA